MRHDTFVFQPVSNCLDCDTLHFHTFWFLLYLQLCVLVQALSEVYLRLSLRSDRSYLSLSSSEHPSNKNQSIKPNTIITTINIFIPMYFSFMCKGARLNEKQMYQRCYFTIYKHLGFNLCCPAPVCLYH